jgi:hypothetical protein
MHQRHNIIWKGKSNRSISISVAWGFHMAFWESSQNRLRRKYRTPLTRYLPNLVDDWGVLLLFYYFYHGVRLSPLGTTATVWTIVPASDDRWQMMRMMMIVEQSVEWKLAGETEVLGENLPQCYFAPHKS